MVLLYDTISQAVINSISNELATKLIYFHLMTVQCVLTVNSVIRYQMYDAPTTIHY